MNFFKKCVKICALLAKKRRLKKMLRVYSNTSAGNDLSKTIISEGANVTLNSKSRALTEQVRDNVKSIVEQLGCDGQKLLGYVKASGTKVYTVMKAEKLLKNIGEEEGFIPEKKGFDALYLSFITFSGLKFKTEPMFVFGKKNPERYLVLYSFYKWYSMQAGLGGFEYEIQKKYNKFIKNINKAKVEKLPLEEIVGLQEAIARDSEATEFVLNYEKETEVSKKVSEKITKDGGASI
ncbi:hypothetical protein J6I39_01615 [bacterium]|nr:hypothetical protein [bacterium]